MSQYIESNRYLCIHYLPPPPQTRLCKYKLALHKSWLNVTLLLLDLEHFLSFFFLFFSYFLSFFILLCTNTCGFIFCISQRDSLFFFPPTLFQDTHAVVMVYDVLQRLGYKTVTGDDVTKFDFLYTRINMFNPHESNRTSRKRYHSGIMVSEW